MKPFHESLPCQKQSEFGRRFFERRFIQCFVRFQDNECFVSEEVLLRQCLQTLVRYVENCAFRLECPCFLHLELISVYMLKEICAFPRFKNAENALYLLRVPPTR